MKRLLNHLTISLLLVLVVSCAHQTSERRHPSCELVLHKSNCIGILPPKAEVKTVGLEGTEVKRMYDYEYRIEDIIADEATKVLQKKGYNVKLYRKRDLKNKKIFGDFDRSREGVQEATKEFYSSNVMMDKEQAYKIVKNAGRYSRAVGKVTNDDVLLYIDYLNTVQTNSARLLGFIMDSFAYTNNTAGADTATIMFTLVDVKTGNVLWSNISKSMRDLLSDFFSGKDDEADRKRMRLIINQTLDPLPDRDKLLSSK